MLTLFRNFIRSFLFDEQAAKRWLRGFLLWAGGIAVSVLAYPYEVVMQWTFREWAYRFGAAAALGFAGAIGVGQKNAAPEDVVAKIAANPEAKQALKEAVQ